MREELAEVIRKSLEGGAVERVVFLTEGGGSLMPHVSARADDEKIGSVYTGDLRYPVASFAAVALPEIGGKLGVVARECDRRMMVELAKHNKLDLERVVLIAIPCSQELAESCACDHPVPPDCKIESDVRPVQAEKEGEEPDSAQTLDEWMEHFSRCIRCYGCRNICPLCFCNECALENPDLIGPGCYPPEVPLFHLIRAVDMADHCVDCGMCEAVCPADIPLRKLYRSATGSVREAFGYEPGIDPDEKSPLETLGEPGRLGGMQEGFRAE